ncbi:hypothetical protein F7725_004950 [Dissostichus mawsoni]|uniref:Uncharacterized protein n=1 Tax=Dissostichus mawsoni TaxID=36200 RepID=A0A7J5XK74_DISMA|nr:hypothetical protein F7725_004950 [Dissostichus mawsoni]
MEVLEPFMVGLTYKSIGREGDDGMLGINNKSWCLVCSNEGCFVTGDGEKSVCLHIVHAPVGYV